MAGAGSGSSPSAQSDLQPQGSSGSVQEIPPDGSSHLLRPGRGTGHLWSRSFDEAEQRQAKEEPARKRVRLLLFPVRVACGALAAARGVAFLVLTPVEQHPARIADCPYMPGQPLKGRGMRCHGSWQVLPSGKIVHPRGSDPDTLPAITIHVELSQAAPSKTTRPTRRTAGHPGGTFPELRWTAPVCRHLPDKMGTPAAGRGASAPALLERDRPRRPGQSDAQVPRSDASRFRAVPA